MMFHAAGSSSCKQTSAMGFLLVVRQTGGQVRIYTVISIQFYLLEGVKALQPSG